MRTLKRIKNEIKKLKAAEVQRREQMLAGTLPPSADPQGKLRSALPPYKVIRQYSHLTLEIDKQKLAMDRVKARVSRRKYKTATPQAAKPETSKKKGRQRFVETK